MHLTDVFVEKLRLLELQSAVVGLDHRLEVLEVGAGSGWQARELNRLGFSVEAVDLPDGHYTERRVWPVRDYDGERLPFPSDRFDLVFTSNVIEHIESLHRHLREELRVLKTGGYMIHVVPSATWRLWTSIAYYPDAVRRLLGRAIRRPKGVRDGHSTDAPPRRRPFELLWAPAHGVGKSSLSELLHFRRASWLRVFEELPVSSIEYWPAGVFYSGHLLFGRALPVGLRQGLSRILGSSCHVFRMRKAAHE